VVNVSHVSYFTGQRIDLAALSAMVRRSNALLVVDATHSCGVVPVDAAFTDVLVSSCYKWLLGVHGTAVFYCNGERLGNLRPPFLGWNSARALPSWQAPTEFELPDGADRFLPGNPGFISLYILENALQRLLDVGIDAIAAHVLELSGRVLEGLSALGLSVMTPVDASERAGNVAFLAGDVDATTATLEQRGIRVWGGYGGVDRVRVSTHLFNSPDDVARLLDAMRGSQASAERNSGRPQ
jgi:selenocysteine lyase/cysteine desulfurase